MSHPSDSLLVKMFMFFFCVLIVLNVLALLLLTPLMCLFVVGLLFIPSLAEGFPAQAAAVFVALAVVGWLSLYLLKYLAVRHEYAVRICMTPLGVAFGVVGAIAFLATAAFGVLCLCQSLPSLQTIGLFAAGLLAATSFVAAALSAAVCFAGWFIARKYS